MHDIAAIMGEIIRAYALPGWGRHGVVPSRDEDPAVNLGRFECFSFDCYGTLTGKRACLPHYGRSWRRTELRPPMTI